MRGIHWIFITKPWSEGYRHFLYFQPHFSCNESSHISFSYKYTICICAIDYHIWGEFQKALLLELRFQFFLKITFTIFLVSHRLLKTIRIRIYITRVTCHLLRIYISMFLSCIKQYFTIFARKLGHIDVLTKHTFPKLVTSLYLYTPDDIFYFSNMSYTEAEASFNWAQLIGRSGLAWSISESGFAPLQGRQ